MHLCKIIDAGMSQAVLYGFGLYCIQRFYGVTAYQKRWMKIMRVMNTWINPMLPSNEALYSWNSPVREIMFLVFYVFFVYLCVFVCDASSSVKSDLRKSAKCFFICHVTDISVAQHFPFMSHITHFFKLQLFLFSSVIFDLIFCSVLMLRLGLGTGISSQNMIFC